MSFQFPQQIIMDGHSWRLVYDPGDPTTVLPDMTTPRVLSVVGGWGQLGGKQVFLTETTLLYPSIIADSYVRPAQMVKGLKVHEKEVSPETVPPYEQAMYMREVQERSASPQTFLDAIIKASVMTPTKPADTSWTEMLNQAQAQPQSVAEGSHE